MTTDPETPIFEEGDKVQYRSGNPNFTHPIATVIKVQPLIKNRHQKITIQFSTEKPRLVYANDYRIVEKIRKHNEALEE